MDPAALISQMVEIQKYTVSREQSEEWAANLRFLHVAKLGAISPKRQSRHIPLTRKGQFPNCHKYVAVSYRWQTPSDPETNPAYLIIDADGSQRGNKAPNEILNRAINFALANRIPFIWIDQECIPNREHSPEEHEIAIQAMDIVYRQSDYRKEYRFSKSIHPAVKLDLLTHSHSTPMFLYSSRLIPCALQTFSRWSITDSLMF